MFLAVPIFIIVLLIISVLCTEYKYRTSPFPPGPRPLPFIGNLHQIPRTDQWRKFKEWHETYGPVISVYLGQQMVIVLGSYDCVHELLDRRGARYSSRPDYYTDGVGSPFHSVALQYGRRWRNHRRILSSFLSSRSCKSYRPLQDLESKQLLHELLSTDKFAKCFHRFAASLTFSLAYGQRMERGDEDEVLDIDRIMRSILEEVKLPSVAFPILNYIPTVLAPWKKRAQDLFEEQQAFFTTNLKRARTRNNWSWSKMIAHIDSASDCDLNEVAFVVGMNYEAGSDTTAFVLETFVLASLLHKPAINNAQAEVDRVIGLRMPEWDDLPNLPYVNAFISEVLRWRPVVPGGLHHAVIEDDVYMGYKIPKGTPIIPNHWSLEFDPSLFPDPEAFEPKRWVQNPSLPSSAFGFGRRICPGKPVAQNSLALTIVRMLWAFTFDNTYEIGREVKIDAWSMTQGISSRPKPFPVSIRPRSAMHQDIIQYQWNTCEKRIDILMEQVTTDA